jgi:hypothetical protein
MAVTNIIREFTTHEAGVAAALFLHLITNVAVHLMCIRSCSWFFATFFSLYCQLQLPQYNYTCHRSHSGNWSDDSNTAFQGFEISLLTVLPPTLDIHNKRITNMNFTPHVPGILSKLVEDKEAASQAETATWVTQCQSKNMVYWRELPLMKLVGLSVSVAGTHRKISW